MRWDKIVNYFNILDEKSPRVEVINLGKTTLGIPFLLTIISSPENLSHIEKYEEISKKLAQGKISKEEFANFSLQISITFFWRRIFLMVFWPIEVQHIFQNFG